MKPRVHRVLSYVYRVISRKPHFVFWLLIRFISAIFPLITIYQFSQVIKLIETKQSSSQIITAIILVFVIRLVDNILRLKSITRLEFEIANISFDVHNYFLLNLKTQTKEERHATIQAVRNFADAVSVTLNLVKQPGIDSIVSFLFIPIILFALDFRTFVLTAAYIAIYTLIDLYTTQHYAHLRDILDGKTENYYGKLQESNDFDLEQTSWTRHFNRIANWAFTEWSLLQNLSVFFYSTIFFYLVVMTTAGYRHLSEVVLIMGYVSQTQVFLNSFSSIQDSLTDMLVGLERLANNQTIATISLNDLI